MILCPILDGELSLADRVSFLLLAYMRTVTFGAQVRAFMGLLRLLDEDPDLSVVLGHRLLDENMSPDFRDVCLDALLSVGHEQAQHTILGLLRSPGSFKGMGYPSRVEAAANQFFPFDWFLLGVEELAVPSGGGGVNHELVKLHAKLLAAVLSDESSSDDSSEEDPEQHAAFSRIAAESLQRLQAMVLEHASRAQSRGRCRTGEMGGSVSPVPLRCAIAIVKHMPNATNKLTQSSRRAGSLMIFKRQCVRSLCPDLCSLYFRFCRRGATATSDCSLSTSWRNTMWLWAPKKRVSSRRLQPLSRTRIAPWRVRLACSCWCGVVPAQS